jgi:hypothetical protein
VRFVSSIAPVFFSLHCSRLRALFTLTFVFTINTHDTRYNVVPCTETSNTRCTNLRAWIIAAYAAGGTVSIIVLSLVIMYVRKKTALRHTVTNLELTERLLGDEREEVELMGQAWSIAEEDLTFGAVIGEGAYGRVYSGMWGHVEVAIKVLRVPFDDLDTAMKDDFDREVAKQKPSNSIIEFIIVVAALSPHRNTLVFITVSLCNR